MRKLRLETLVIVEYECKDDEVEGLKTRLRESILTLYDNGLLTGDTEAECTSMDVTPEWCMENKTTNFNWDKIRGFIPKGD